MSSSHMKGGKDASPKYYNDFRFEPIERFSGHRLEDGDLASEFCSDFALAANGP